MNTRTENRYKKSINSYVYVQTVLIHSYNLAINEIAIGYEIYKNIKRNGEIISIDYTPLFPATYSIISKHEQERSALINQQTSLKEVCIFVLMQFGKTF